MSTASVFGKNLRNKLEERNKSQSDLARHLKTTTATVSRWVNGESLPRAKMIDRICTFLSCTTEELMRDFTVAPVLLPEDVIAEEIRENPKLFQLFIASMRATDEQLDAMIELLKK